MAELVACLGSGKGSWGHVSKLISGQDWDRVFIIADKFFKEKIELGNADIIIIDSDKYLSLMVEDIKNQLKDKIKGIEVAINLFSGTGKEHMAIVAALLKLGVGIRLVALTPDGIKEV